MTIYTSQNITNEAQQQKVCNLVLDRNPERTSVLLSTCIEYYPKQSLQHKVEYYTVLVPDTEKLHSADRPAKYDIRIRALLISFVTLIVLGLCVCSSLTLSQYVHSAQPSSNNLHDTKIQHIDGASAVKSSMDLIEKGNMTDLIEKGNTTDLIEKGNTTLDDKFLLPTDANVTQADRGVSVLDSLITTKSNHVKSSDVTPKYMDSFSDAVFSHDFRRNVSIVRDERDERDERCYISPMIASRQTERIIVPEKVSDLLKLILQTGDQVINSKSKRIDYTAGEEITEPELSDNYGEYIAELCSTYPTYKLIRVTEQSESLP